MPAADPKRAEAELWELLEAFQTGMLTALDGVQLRSRPMHVIDDRERLKALWSPFVDVWFEGGPEDPDAILLRMDVDRTEFWDGTKNRLVQAWELANASTIGRRPDLADHRRIG